MSTVLDAVEKQIREIMSKNHVAAHGLVLGLETEPPMSMICLLAIVTDEDAMEIETVTYETLSNEISKKYGPSQRQRKELQ